MKGKCFPTCSFLWLLVGSFVLTNCQPTAVFAQGPDPDPPKTHLIRVECKGSDCCMYELDQYPGNVEMNMAADEHVVFLAKGRAVQLEFVKLGTSSGDVCTPQNGTCEPIKDLLNIPANQWAEVKVPVGEFCVRCENCSSNSCKEVTGGRCKSEDPELQTVPAMLVVAK